MSFRKLEQAFQAVFELNRGKEVVGTSGLDNFRALYLMTLFEINGNLDTIALSMRAIVEQADAKGGLVLGELSAIREALQASAVSSAKSLERAEALFVELKKQLDKTSAPIPFPKGPIVQPPAKKKK